MNRIFTYTTILLLTVFSFEVVAQALQGQVLNKNNNPVAYVNIFIKELKTGTTTNESGNYFYSIIPGNYEVVFSAIGYKPQTVNVEIRDENLIQNIVLQASSIKLNEIMVKAGKRDPAYAIIQNAIDNKKKYSTYTYACKTEVYIKATENIENSFVKEDASTVEEKERGKRGSHLALNAPNIPDSIANLNLLEMSLTLNFKAPNLYKEERTAYKLYGNKAGLFLPSFAENNFNFYKNYVPFTGVTELPVISPLSRTAILSYKYKLVETLVEEGQSVFKIKVIPRKKGNATCKGFIYINDGLWNINRLELQLSKGALKFYDSFQFNLNYKALSDSLWLPGKQSFIYKTKNAKKRTYLGNTLIVYSNFRQECDFPSNFFKNEVAVTDKQAYKRDSVYWQQKRVAPLSKKQAQVISYRDSVEQVINSKPYKDSVEAVYNKIEALEILWFGVGFQNHEKKTNLFIPSLASLLEFDVIGGFRLGPSAGFSKRFDNGKILRTDASVNLGIKHKDIQGYVGAAFTYNPHKLATARLGFGREFAFINFDDAYLNIVQPSNFILADYLRGRHQFELLNGLYLRTNFNYTWRQAIPEDMTNVFENWFPPGNIEDWIEEPLEFEPYESLITEVGFSYTPMQKYMTEPDRKLVLGSKFPTFEISYKRGWNNFLGSDIEFDYLEFSVHQNLLLGQFGTSKYQLSSGRYLNTNQLNFVDAKRFRQSDPWLYSNPLRSFQLLDTALILDKQKVFFEAHHIHHFNGALINNIPLVKKLGIRLVSGAGFLWMQSNNFRHQEAFTGLERIFKLGPRRRLRLGFYGVAANGNYVNFKTGYKFSIDVIDTWRRDWSF